MAKEDISTDKATKVQIQETYGKLPLYFIQNNGQMDERVKFYEKGSGRTTFFAKDGVYLLLGSSKQGADNSKKSEGKPEIVANKAKPTSPNIPSPLAGEGQGGGSSEFIHLTFLNANKNPEIIAEDIQEGKVNYFIGKDPAKWRTNIQTYKSVVYKEVYPGIDIKFYGNNRQMEYDIIVKPGADPSRVRFAYEGIKDLKVAENGDLEIVLTEGSIIQKKPAIYQEIDGKRVAVDGRFVIARDEVTSDIASPEGSKQSPSILPSPLMGEGRVGVPSGITSPPLLKGGEGGLAPQFTYTFEVASYEKTHPLIIDPTLVYSTYLGGSNYDYGSDIAVDASGNVYITGHTNSTDFPIVSPIYGTCGGCPSFDAFVTKIDASGSSLVYSTYIGGSGYEYSYGIAVDASENVYITGSTYSTDFPTASPIQGAKAGSLSYDAFVTKIDTSGSSLVYSTYLGGGASDAGYDIAVDTSGNAYITGTTPSTDFPTASPIYGTKAGGKDAFVAKINTSGSSLIYSTYLGGSGEESDYGRIAVDASGNAYITGRTSSTDFPTASPIQGANAGGTDAFITKIDASGSSLVYSTYLGGWLSDSGSDIAVDASGNAYITGTTYSPDYPTTSPFQSAIAGVFDVFVTKVNTSGTALVYSTYLGGSDRDYGHGIAVDAAGNAYVSGYTNSTDFPTASPIYGTKAGGQDVFVAKINTSGSSLIYSTYLGGSGEEWDAGRIAIDTSGSAYITGSTLSTDFPTTSAYQGTNAGSIDAFVAKISAFPTVELPRTGQTTCYDTAGAVIPCAGTGQDGEIQAGVAWPNPRFTDNGNATVTDNLTGLMWTKDGNAPGPGVCSPATTKTWQGALDYVVCLNTNSYLGYTDWHLPNVNELESLVNAAESNTATWLNAQGFNNVQSYYYWSSTTMVYIPSAAWAIRIWDGYMGSQSKSSPIFYVMPVRSGQSGVVQLSKTGETTCYDSAGSVIACAGTGQDGEIQAGVAWPSPRFSNNGNDAVTDNLTGLMWTKDANLMAIKDPGFDTDDLSGDGRVTWQRALNYVAKLNTETYLGYTDWRLPNRKELQSLIDRSRYNPDLPSGHPFINVEFAYWSSTSYAYDSSFAWHVGIAITGVGPSGKTTGLSGPLSDYYYVWPVRGGQIGASSFTEICDGIDNDGNGEIDEGFPAGNTSCGHDVAVTPNGETVTFGAVTFSGNTAVTISNSGPTPPLGYTLGRTPSYHDITTTAAFSGTAKVCIAYDATNFTTERALRLLHHNGIKWDDITTTLDTTANIICGVTTSFSPFIVAQQASTAVTLSNLSAKADGDNVSLTWSTRSETDNEGFVVVRSEYQNGPFSPVSSMIPAAGGPGMTATYTFTDSNVGQGKTYYYRLQDVDSRGVVTTHNVIPVTTVVAGGEKPSQKIQGQKQDIQGIPQEIGKKSGRDSVGTTELPPTLILPRKGGGDEEGGPVVSSSAWIRDAEVEIASTDSVSLAMTSQTKGAHNDRSSHPHPASPVKGEEYFESSAAAKEEYSEPAAAMTGVIALHTQGPSSFSVSIEDDKGNIIMVNRVADTGSKSTSTGDLMVTNEPDGLVLTWQGKGKVKGFILHRAEKGKDNYAPISKLIPYFGRDGKDIFLYRFTDNSAKPGINYDYRLEVVTPGQAEITAQQ